MDPWVFCLKTLSFFFLLSMRRKSSFPSLMKLLFDPGTEKINAWKQLWPRYSVICSFRQDFYIKLQNITILSWIYSNPFPKSSDILIILRRETAGMNFFVTQMQVDNSHLGGFKHLCWLYRVRKQSWLPRELLLLPASFTCNRDGYLCPCVGGLTWMGCGRWYHIK